MKKILIFCSFVILVSSNIFFMNIIRHSNNDDLIIKSSYALYGFDVNDIEERIIQSDYIFVGRVKEFENTLSFDGTGINMPYSIYTVEVIKILKGVIETKEIEIVYYGGVEEDELFLLDPDFKK